MPLAPCLISLLFFQDFIVEISVSLDNFHIFWPLDGGFAYFGPQIRFSMQNISRLEPAPNVQDPDSRFI